MCRIAGIVSLNSDLDISLSRMLHVLDHGGPDDEGKYIDGSVAFGHRRLSIIDLTSSGHQPMLTSDEQLIVSFNGEIYNFQELRVELEGAGRIFRSKTDTEVILHAYAQWGTNSFERFQGIFAFSIYDKRAGKLLLVRDQMGVKPLYYCVKKDELVFASEVRAFKAYQKDWPENQNWKILFLAFGSLPHPVTTLKDVYQIPPGAYLEMNVDTFATEIVQYYSIARSRTLISDEGDALRQTREAVHEAVRKNLIADVPVGIFLSGGIDSSLLTLLADKMKDGVSTISVNFEDASFDEGAFQSIVLKKTSRVKHASCVVSEKMFWEKLDDIWHAMDQPSIDGVNSYFVALCARQHGLKVVLSGLGADEFFGGYKSTTRVKWLRRLRAVPGKKMIANIAGHYNSALKRILFLNIPGAVGDYLFLRGIYTPDTIASLLNLPESVVWNALMSVKITLPEDLHDQEYVSFLESKFYMTNQLLKDTDYMSMWHGLEVRVPFLDIELIKKLSTIAPALRYREDWPKFLLTASHMDILPREIVFRKKYGFTFPFLSWLKSSPDRFAALLPKTLVVEKLAKKFKVGRIHWSKYWSVAVLQQFR